MNISHKRVLLTSLAFFLGLGVFVFTPKSLNAGKDYILEGYFQCSTHGFQQDKDCGSINTNFPSGRTDFTAAALSYQFLGHRHGSSHINARVCLFSVGNTGECRDFSCSGNSCGHEYGGQHPFNLLGEGSIFVNAFTGSSGFYMYRSASVEDAEVRINASASADYLELPPPPEPEITVSATMVNLNFVVKDQYDKAINLATVTIGNDFGNGTVRTTDANGFANFGVSANKDVAYTVTAGGCAGVSAIQNSGPSGVTVPVTLICSGATPPANPPAPLILCTDPTATNNGLAAPCVYAPPSTACLDNSTVVVTQPLPERMSPGQTASYTMRVTNTGQTWWADGTYYQFLKKSGNMTTNPLYGHLPFDKYPGQFTDWTFSFTAPATLGSYVSNMQMIHKSGYAYKLPDGSVCAPSPASDTYFGQGESAFTNVANCPLPTSETRGVPCSAEPAPYGPGWRGNIFETRTKDPISCNWGSWVRPWSAATWCQRYYILNVAKAGTGTGTVTSNTGTISCGTNCSEQYGTGSSVTLTATANTGSSFAGWGGDADCSDGMVTMNSDKNCTATFNTNPLAPTPDIRLNVPTWGYTNFNVQVEVPMGVAYSVSWGAVANATSCTLDGVPVSVSGASVDQGLTSQYTKTHTLTCINSAGQSSSDSITIITPPEPLTFTYSCNLTGTQATLNWTLPAGYTGGYIRGPAPFWFDVASGLTSVVNVIPNTTYNNVRVFTRASNTSWSAVGVNIPTISCIPNTAPTVGSVTINSAVVNPNNINQYTIKISGTDSNGNSDIKYLEVLINGDFNSNGNGANAGQYRGLLVWNVGPALQPALESKTCGGGTGYIYASNFNPSYIHLDSCSVSNSGNTREVSFVVRFDPTFTTPATDNDLSGIVGDNSGQFSPWMNFNGFDLLLASPSGTLTVPTCVIATGASTCNTTISWTTQNLAGGDVITVRKDNVNILSGDSNLGVSNTLSRGAHTFLLVRNGNLATPLDNEAVNVDCNPAVATWNGAICQANAVQFDVSVTKTPSSGGTVTGGAINCGSVCLAQFSQNSTVTLTAVPKSSYWKFDRWTGDCSGTSPTCTFTVNGAKSVQAEFSLRDFQYHEF